MAVTTSNPTLRDGTFRGFTAIGEERMTVNGTIGKTLILLVILAFTATFTWNSVFNGNVALGYGLSMAGGITGFIISIVLSFRQSWAPVLAPVFAAVEGLFLGAISASYALTYQDDAAMFGIVTQAMLGTLAVFLTMLTTYRAGLIKVTDRFRAIVTTAMFAVFLVYLVSFALSFTSVQIPYIHESNPIGIGFSLLVIGIASLMLLVDFDLIERGAASGAPKFMEWYGGFALLVTLIWIYLEILRLLAKLRGR